MLWGPALGESESVAWVQAASLEIPESVAGTMRHAGARDERLAAEIVRRTARQAVTAWAMAVDGDATTLAAMAQPDAAHWLLHPVWKSWQVAAGPKVTEIAIWDLEADARPPRLRIEFRFTGRRRFADPARSDIAGTIFTGMLDLELQPAGPWPWQLVSGHVQTLDEFLGYVFTSRRETPEEYRQRSGSSAIPATTGSPRVFRLTAGFADHDARFGSASVTVQRESAPARDEAEDLIWPAIREVTRQTLGEGDWRPSLGWLDVIELLAG